MRNLFVILKTLKGGLLMSEHCVQMWISFTFTDHFRNRNIFFKKKSNSCDKVGDILKDEYRLSNMLKLSTYYSFVVNVYCQRGPLAIFFCSNGTPLVLSALGRGGRWIWWPYVMQYSMCGHHYLNKRQTSGQVVT